MFKKWKTQKNRNKKMLIYSQHIDRVHPANVAVQTWDMLGMQIPVQFANLLPNHSQAHNTTDMWCLLPCLCDTTHIPRSKTWFFCRKIFFLTSHCGALGRCESLCICKLHLMVESHVGLWHRLCGRQIETGLQMTDGGWGSRGDH